jgi:hypothetical protein
VRGVRAVRGCRTQGRTVDEARRRVERRWNCSLELFVDNGRKASIVDDVKLAEVKPRPWWKFE